jgi:RNA polymerase sigma factor (sigma-70 family)
VKAGVLGRSALSIFQRGDEDLAAVPSIGRASRVEGAGAPEADVTRALYEEYANQVFRYCLHQLGSREEAEDAVQSTFLNAFRGIKRGVVPELEAAWLFKIAHNVCLSRRRSAWRRGRIESPADFEVIEEVTPAPSRRADELIGLQEVLERLPETQRRAILLREWQGLSYREIAAELELSQGAVETLIFRARRSLASGLERPLESKRRRVARALDWGNVLAGIKAALIGGSVAAKVAATVAVVSATTVVAAEPLQHQRHHVASVPKVQPKVHVAPAVTAPIVHQAAVSVAPAAPAVAAPKVHKQKASHSHRSAHAAFAPAGAPAETPVSEQPAPSEPAKADKHQGNGNGGHGRQKDERTTSAFQPVEPQPPVSDSSAQTAPATDVSTQDSNGHGAHGNGKSKDKSGDG